MMIISVISLIPELILSFFAIGGFVIFSFLLTLLMLLLHVAVNTEDTVLLRGSINQSIMASTMASTIAIWNYNNTNLWKYTKKCLRRQD